MSIHLTYAEAVVTGLIQGVTELFPVSSLGHNVLLPALIGGSWAKALSVSAPDSPYLAFVVGLHVATAIGMIAYFWRDWLRIVSGFISSVRTRSVSTPDERLAWMIILATIPVGIAGVALQKVFTHVFAKPELTAIFLAINGLILLYSERRRRIARGVGAAAAEAADRAPAP
jgi:undecaprenyl-diphosphatase